MGFAAVGDGVADAVAVVAGDVVAVGDVAVAVDAKGGDWKESVTAWRLPEVVEEAENYVEAEMY